MPPTRKFTRQRIIDTAYEMVRKDGMEALHTRSIAKKLGCSVQPIFHNFQSMEELRKEVVRAVYETYVSVTQAAAKQAPAYKSIGLAYIRFARDYPEFFRILFMSESHLDAKAFIMSDAMSDRIIKEGCKMTGLSYELQKQFHVKVWIFTHGIACLLLTKTVVLSDDEIRELLEQSVREMCIGFLKTGGQQSES